MPTTVEQVCTIKNIVDEYLPAERATELFDRLFNEVGQFSDNQSVKLSLQMLSAIYKTKSAKELMSLYESYDA